MTALDHLFGRHELIIRDVEKIALHGGSLRLFVSRNGGSRGRSVRDFLASEHETGMTTFAYYRDFGTRVQTLRDDLVRLLRRLKTEGHRLAAYGAAAKGTTLLSFCGIGADVLDFVVDRSTVKQGRFMPGTQLPILPPDALLERRPDYVLLLTWNLADEILAQQAAYRAGGGRFILPVPSPKIA
jgi:hypothetical protein